jgi:hypothetical protein
MMTGLRLGNKIPKFFGVWGFTFMEMQSRANQTGLSIVVWA